MWRTSVAGVVTMAVGVCVGPIVTAGSIGTTAEPAAEAQRVQNHPLIQPYAGSTLTRRDDEGFQQYKAVVGLDQKGKTDDDIIRTSTVSGRLTRLAYENPRDRSPVEILANYREGLEKAGFTVLFQCGGTQCGPGWATSRWTRVTGLRYVSSDMQYLSARRESPTGTVHVAMSIIGLRHAIDILEGTAMETGLVTVTEAAIKTGLLNEGRVVLDGVYFDSDKATITPASKPALDVIAKFLADNASLQVFIVGHTDSVGTFDYNLTLSRQRAQAVVDRLVQDYQIASTRLAAHGVGPLSPSRTNATDQGKAVNRRVEMVAR